MSVEILGASHLASQNFEVQRTNNFEIQIDNVSDQRTLTLAVVSGFLPNESSEVISLSYGNTKTTVAGVSNFNNSGTLVVRDIIQKDIEKVIDDWRSTVTNKSDDSIGFAYDYKKSATVTQCAPDGSYERVWKLYGVWPSAVDYGSVSYDSPGAKQISITLQYDKAVLDRRDFYHQRDFLG